MHNACKPLPAPVLAEVSFSTSEGPLPLLTDAGLAESCGLVIGFSGRRGGVSEGPFSSLNISHRVDDDPAAVAKNKELVLQAMGAADFAERLITPDQVHGERIFTVGDDIAAAQESCEEGVDAVLCTRPGVPVSLCFADCVPVIIAAPGGAFAIAHSGWRGAIASISGKTLAALAREVRCAPGDCNVYIGPHIGPCCYETSEEILQRFVQRFGPECDAGKSRLDLHAAVVASLLEGGAQPARIAWAGICTRCNSGEWFSYRAQDGLCGRHGAWAFRPE